MPVRPGTVGVSGYVVLTRLAMATSALMIQIMALLLVAPASRRRSCICPGHTAAALDIVI